MIGLLVGAEIERARLETENAALLAGSKPAKS